MIINAGVVIKSLARRQSMVQVPVCSRVVFLAKSLYSHSATRHPGVQKGTSELLGHLAKCWRRLPCSGLACSPGGGREGVAILLVASGVER